MFHSLNNSKSLVITLFSAVMATSVTGCNQNPTRVSTQTTQSDQLAENIAIWPKLNIAVKKDNAIEKRISELLATMTLEQKIAQMIQPEIRDITVEDMRKYGFGSYLNGGGAFPNNDKHATPADWIKLAEDMYQASVDDSLDGSTIPTIWGTDAVHGHNNVVGATLFPHNIGLGATNNSELIEQIAAITAKEVMVTGIDWVFAPTVAVVRDDRWGRTYEGYSEDPEIVRNYSAAIVKGLQGSAEQDFLGDERVISTVKHFIGDGGTEGGDDQGNNLVSEQELFDIHAQGYVGGLSAGSQSVMASFNSWHGIKNHGNKYLLTDVLKTQMGFDGFVVGDWNGHGQVKGCTNESCPQSINAGLDIFMVPTKAWKPLYENTLEQVNRGIIPLARIDDAVSRILRVKIRAGIFDKPSPANRILSGKTALIGAKAHRDVARQAVRESLVLLKNTNKLLPLSTKQNILITGDGADNIGKQSGGWTITWQGTGNNNDDFPGGTSIYDGFKEAFANATGILQLSDDGSFNTKPDVAVVVFGEEPYAEGNGDLDNLEYQRGDKTDLALLKKLQAQGIPVVAVFISGRPMWMNAELNAADAFVAAWLPGSEGAGIADVLIAKENGDIAYDFKGKLSFSWPASVQQTRVNRFDNNYQPLLPYGYGLTYAEQESSAIILLANLPETSSVETSKLSKMKVFDRSVQKPWRENIQSGDKNIDITSNVQKLGAINYRTLDKTVQEDARAISFDGSDNASINMLSSFPEDLRAFSESLSALKLTVKVDNKATSDVYLSMLCEGTNVSECKARLNITNLINGLPENKWQDISIDLHCFIDAGLDLAKVMTAFKLSTQGRLSLSYTDIYLSSQEVEQSTKQASKLRKMACSSSN